jgi:hypothetical protein
VALCNMHDRQLDWRLLDNATSHSVTALAELLGILSHMLVTCVLLCLFQRVETVCYVVGLRALIQRGCNGTQTTKIQVRRVGQQPGAKLR